jgi:hypothetical protein
MTWQPTGGIKRTDELTWSWSKFQIPVNSIKFATETPRIIQLLTFLVECGSRWKCIQQRDGCCNANVFNCHLAFILDQFQTYETRSHKINA